MKHWKKKKVKCPKCKSDKNIIQLISGYRCIYCNLRFYAGEEAEQTKLWLTQ